jgi:hypothetical protein
MKNVHGINGSFEILKLLFKNKSSHIRLTNFIKKIKEIGMGTIANIVT